MSWHIITTSNVLSLSCSDVSNHGLGISVIILVYFMSCLLQDPVILIVVIVATLIHQIFEYFSHVVVIRSFLEFQISAILQISVKFLWKSPRQRLNRCRHFLVLDSVILIVLILSLKALPRQISLQKVE